MENPLQIGGDCRGLEWQRADARELEREIREPVYLPVHLVEEGSSVPGYRIHTLRALGVASR